MSRRYAVTGATGHLGSAAVAALLEAGVAPGDVVGVVRSEAKAGDLAARGVGVREADYEEPARLAAALTRVDRLLLVSSSAAGRRVAHHANVIDAAAAAGVERIVYTSMLNADRSTNPLAVEHLATEELLRQSGLAYTAARNGWYTENYLYALAEQVASGEILGATGGGRISAAARGDYAQAAAAALLADEGDQLVYELGGPSFDLYELAGILTDVTGQPVVYRDLPGDEYATRLQDAGTPDETARFIAELDASISRGDLKTDSRDLDDLLRRAPTPPVEVVRRAWAAVAAVAAPDS